MTNMSNDLLLLWLVVLHMSLKLSIQKEEKGMQTNERKHINMFTYQLKEYVLQGFVL